MDMAAWLRLRLAADASNCSALALYGIHFAILLEFHETGLVIFANIFEEIRYYNIVFAGCVPIVLESHLECG